MIWSESVVYAKNTDVENKVTESSLTVTNTYIDQNSQKAILLETTTVVNQDSNSSLVQIKQIDGYTYVQSKKANNNTMIINYYQKNINLSIRYIDENGNLIDSKALTGLEANSFSETAKNIDGYKFIGAAKTINGVFKQDLDSITFIYKKDVINNEYDYTINYLEAETKKTINQSYKTKDDAILIQEPHEIIGYEYLNNITSKEVIRNGKYVNINYYYKIKDVNNSEEVVDKNYKLVVKHKELDTNKILAIEEENSDIAIKYKSNKKDFKNYRLVEIKGESKGITDKEYTEIVYIYKQEKAVTINYTVNYIDIENKGSNPLIKIIPSDTYVTTDQNWVANPYTIRGYQYLKSNGEDNIERDGDNITVNYYYSKISNETPVKEEELKATLILKYIDADTQKIIEKIEHTSIDGLKYNPTAKEIDGYKLIKTIGNNEGYFKIGVTNVNHYYVKENKTYDHIYIVNYLDNTTKDSIISSDVYIRNEKDKWIANPYEIAGYKYLRSNGMDNVDQSGNTINVNYYYQKISDEDPIKKDELVAKLVIKYLDIDTNKILFKIDETTIDGLKYTTIKKDFENYRFIKVEGNESGLFSVGTTNVTYYYKSTLTNTQTPTPKPTPENEDKQNENINNDTDKDKDEVQLPKTGNEFLFISIMFVSFSILVLLSKKHYKI
ncbi:MucBP domain-containing protein [Mycoplasma sp. P36-A1]|uniref:MucBP domain-containing protein n=1 Tax=Mycoplasma sp. P36-A1 TaxID=3252900 RepID=UPI003C306C4E